MQTLSTIPDSLGSMGNSTGIVDMWMQQWKYFQARLPMLTINITPTVKVRFSSCLKQKIQKFNEFNR